MPSSWTDPLTVTPGTTLTLQDTRITFETPHVGQLSHVFAVIEGPGGRKRVLIEPYYATRVGGVKVRLDELAEGEIKLRWSTRREATRPTLAWWRRGAATVAAAV